MQGFKHNMGDRFSADVHGSGNSELSMLVGETYHFECWRYEVASARSGGRVGELVWEDDVKNLVVDEGLNDLLDKYFKGSSYTAAHYLGLTDGTPTVAAGDTMSSHSGWSEVTAYDETARQTIVWGTVASKSVDNSSNKATFTIKADSTTIGGAFVVTNSTKGGTTGIL